MSTAGLMDVASLMGRTDFDYTPFAASTKGHGNIVEWLMQDEAAVKAESP
jgi:hypothetical protein